jgi:KDO2-lipid IV(A) lauroyltransferase
MNLWRLVMQALSHLPLSWLRALGWLLGQVLFRVSARRGHVVAANIALCWPELHPMQQRQLAQQHFVWVAQSLLDRAWLWHAPEKVLRQRLTFAGDFAPLKDPSPLIMLAPHFVGLDAGGVALTVLKQVHMACVYVPLSDPYAQDWMMQGRNRSGRLQSVARQAGPKPLLQALREGQRLHFSPDMDFGLEGAIWSRFFGVPAATLTSLPRFAKLTGARVCTVVTRLTPQGYCLEMGPVWADFPSHDLAADTLRMNQDIEAWVRQSPAQYYWVHKRFKTRPEGEPSVYEPAKSE